MQGIVSTDDALARAREAGVDLVEVSPNERPPVCKIMDYGKQKYLQSKKQKQRHHEQRLKEVRMRPKTDPHDKEIKLNRARRFLNQGDRVQFTMMFRGRERFHREVGLKAFDAIVAMLEDVAKLEQPARTLGRRMTMTLVPLKSGGAKKPPKPAKKPSAPAAVPSQVTGTVPVQAAGPSVPAPPEPPAPEAGSPATSSTAGPAADRPAE